MSSASTLPKAWTHDELKACAHRIPEHLRAWWLHYLDAHRGHYETKLASMGDPARSGRVLEVGSVPGHFTAQLARLGYSVTGVDLAPDRLGTLPEAYGFRVVACDIERERLPFEEGSFDTILFCEILEHLRVQPIHALREVARVLAPGGRVILSTPNITLSHRWRFLMGEDYQGDPVREFGKLETVGHMGHIRLYSLNEIRGMLAHVGLTVVGTEYHGRKERQRRSDRVLQVLARHPRHRAKFVYVTAASSR